MHLTAITFGSRGDVEPFATLARGLAAAGHHVRLLTHGEYAPLVAGTQVDFVASRGRSTRELVESEEGREVLAHARRPLTMLRQLAAVLAPEVEVIYQDVLRAVRDTDAVLAFPATFPALDVAAQLGRPAVHVHHVPVVPTRGFPVAAPYVRSRTLTPLGNRWSYTVDAWLLWQLVHSATDLARRAVLGADAGPYRLRRALAQRRRPHGRLVGVSRHVLPPPPDWPAGTAVCGYWWPADGPDGPPPLAQATRRFLDAGPPPLFVGLGSTPVPDSEFLTQQLAAAARRAQVRIILQRGWAGLGETLDDPHIHLVGDVSYQALFPHVAGVVHHGGAGTTALGLRWGRPTLCLPAVADQFFWGHRVAAVGAGPAPLPLARLRADRLATRLVGLTEPRYADRAAQIAGALAGEDAGAAAVTALEGYLRSDRSQPD